MRFLGLVGLMTILLFSFRITLTSLTSEQEDFADDDLQTDTKKVRTFPKKQARTLSSNSSRFPASSTEPTRGPAQGPLEREKDFEKFQDFASEEKDVEKTYNQGPEIIQDTEDSVAQDAPRRRSRPQTQAPSRVPESVKTNVGENESFTITNIPYSSTTPTIPVPEQKKPTPSGTLAPSAPLTCQASVGGGTFNSPINVSLDCSTASTISYCLSEGSCCDPVSGATYALPLTIGATESTFCLSFIGRDTSGKQSLLTQQTYTFSSSAPNLQVNYEKLVYQTTELDGFLSLSSDDFGSATISGGVMNFKNSDPVLSGYPSCAEQVESAAPLSPILVMADTPLSHLNPSMQLDVFFGNLELVYGENFITSYLLNSAYGNQYSCSTTKIVLEDFPYFDHVPVMASTAAGVHEFSGGFTSVGFFQAPAPSITRIPAGTSIDDNDGQELRSGLFGIFY